MPKTNRDMMAPKTARGDIAEFFANIMERKFSDAERALNSVKEKPFDNDEFKNGYLTALGGILLSSRSGDARDFLNRAPFNPKSMEGYRKEFDAFIKDGIHTPFDEGYFSAWLDFLHHRINSGG